MKNKNENIPTTKLRQIELLKKYYPLDEKRKAFKIQLYYKSVNEILNDDVSDYDHPRIDDEKLDRISNILENIPNGYSADLSFSFDDYEGYQPEKILESINDAVEINHYSFQKDNKKRWIITAILLVIGIFILSIRGFFDISSMFSNEKLGEIFDEIIEIAGWVFVWESVTVLFLSPSERGIVGARFIRKVNNISLYQEGNDNPLVSEGRDKIFSSWVNESKIKKISKYLLLFGGVVLVINSVLSIIESTHTLINIDASASENLMIYVIFSIATIILSFVGIIAGLAAIERYNDGNKLSKFLLPTSIVLSLFLIFQIVVIIIQLANGYKLSWFTSLISLIALISYSAGYFLSLDYKKKK